MRVRFNSGVALVTALLVLSILAVVGMGIATLGSGNLGVAVNQRQVEAAYQVAEAGLSVAKSAYGVNPLIVAAPATRVAWPASAQVMPNDPNSNFVCNITIPSAAPIVLPNGSGTITVPVGEAYIEAYGTVGNGSPTATTKAVAAMVERTDTLFRWPVVGDGNITTSCANPGDTVVDAWNGGGNYPGTGLARGKGQVATDEVGTGSPVITIDMANIESAHAGPGSGGGTYSITNSGCRAGPNLGIRLNLGPPIPWNSVVNSSGTTANATISGLVGNAHDITSSTTLAGGAPNLGTTWWGNVTVATGMTLTLAPGYTYVFKSLTMTPGSTLAVQPGAPGNPSTSILLMQPPPPPAALGSLAMDGATIDNPYNAGSLLLQCTTNAQLYNIADAGAGSRPYFVFYNDMPNNVPGFLFTTWISGAAPSGCAIYGSVVSQGGVTLEAKAHIHYDMNLHVSGGAGGAGTPVVEVVSYQRL